MDRILAWIIGGFFGFLLIFCAILGSSFEESEGNGYYYGTKEWMWPVRNAERYLPILEKEIPRPQEHPQIIRELISHVRKERM